MSRLGLAAAAAIALVTGAQAVDAEAHKILGTGKWALIEEALSAEAAEKASACTGTAMSFAFTVSETQRIPWANGAPSGPPDFFADATAVKDEPYTVISLFAGKGDAKPAAVYSHDPSVDTLMLMGDDGDGTAIYVRCKG